MTIAYVGLGSNMGDGQRTPGGTLTAAIEALASLGRVLSRSSFYQTEPVGFSEQARFVNAVVKLETIFEPDSLMENLLSLERTFGRDRSSGVRNGPRTLDLDLLMADDLVLRSEQLTLPHPRLAERRFVLAPLAEIAPELRHPMLDATMQQLLERLPRDGENGPEAVRRLEVRAGSSL